MDGKDLTRDSGYGGDCRFFFIGASTPLKSRAWDVMGNAGYRFVFYHKDQRANDHETVKNSLFGESKYSERVHECKQKLQSFLHRLWNEHGGYGSIPDNKISFSDDAQDAIPYLAKIVRFSRATLTNRSGKEDPAVSRENLRRVGAVLRDIAKGRALTNGETKVTIDNLVVSSRIALSTMANKRRPLVRALLDPSNDGQLTRKEAQNAFDVSKPTVFNRMRLMHTLGIAEFTEVEGDSREIKKFELKDEFEWSDTLPFPSQ
jgi:hypothetical protein